MTDEHEIEFFFDIASPYSYLASTQIDALEEDTGLPVRWRPFLLGGVMKATGNEPPARVDEKARYMLSDLNRWADRYGIPFELPSDFPINSLTTQRALVAVDEMDAGEVPEFADALYRAYWVEDTDLSQGEAVAEVADDVGLPGDEIVSSTQESHIEQRLQENSDEAVDRGAFGAPTFFLDGEMFWGNDRLDFLREAASEIAS